MTFHLSTLSVCMMFMLSSSMAHAADMTPRSLEESASASALLGNQLTSSLPFSQEEDEIRRRVSDEQLVRVYRVAADLGFALAQCELGVCYLKGQGVEKDDRKAVRLFHLAADQGYASAQCNLGACYANGTGGVERNYAEAARLFRLAADQGLALAQCNLGMCYENGHGVKRNHDEAVRLYRLAADQGLEEAIRKLRSTKS